MGTRIVRVTTLRQHLRRLAAIALMAVLGIVFAPTVSHALSAAGSGNPWAEICSIANGTAPVQAPTQSAPAPHLDHCPLCGLADGAAPIPVAVAAWDAAGGEALLPARFLHAPRTLHAWASAQPRAPPITC